MTCRYTPNMRCEYAASASKLSRCSRAIFHNANQTRLSYGAIGLRLVVDKPFEFIAFSFTFKRPEARTAVLRARSG